MSKNSRICKVCSLPILKNQKIIVISCVKTINNSGDYDILQDHIPNQSIAHKDCFFKKNNDISLNEYLANSKDILESIYSTLSCLGEKVSRPTVDALYIKYMTSNVDDFIVRYYKDKRTLT